MNLKTQFLDWLSVHQPYFAPVTDVDVNGDEVIVLDLSETNTDLEYIDFRDNTAFPSYLETLLMQENASMAIGGYNEKRFVYRDKALFNDGEQAERFIHLGIDCWLPAGAPIYAPFAGIIHSFADNKGAGNYGPTIILEHQPVHGPKFYTLYGHLCRDSIQQLKNKDAFEAGQQLARLGVPIENGNWTPHLHFQIILDIQGYQGDYPGVASLETIEMELENCPDPNLIIQCPLLG